MCFHIVTSAFYLPRQKMLKFEGCFHTLLYFCDNFYTMSFSFQARDALSEFQIYKNTTWKNINIGQEISSQLETNQDSKKIDPYCCAI